MAAKKDGIILKGIGGFYYVKTGDGIVECRACGRFRNVNLTPMVGDKVSIIINSDGSGYIESIFERKNYIIRPPISNIDQLFIVISQKDPATDLLFIDKVIAAACLKKIEPIIIINKTDIDPACELYNIYEKAGYKVIRVCAKRAEGRPELLELLSNKITAFAGSSGVGKSSLLNMIDSSFAMQVGEISAKNSRGRHTTRHVELFELPCGGYIADTPGFGSFEIEKMQVSSKEELQFAFREFEPYITSCRYVGCSHTKERGCAVLEALNNGAISKSRHESYCAIYEVIKNIKDWEKTT